MLMVAKKRHGSRRAEARKADHRRGYYKYLRKSCIDGIYTHSQRKMAVLIEAAAESDVSARARISLRIGGSWHRW